MGPQLARGVPPVGRIGRSGSLTLTESSAGAQAPFRQPSDRVDAVGAVQQHLEVQVRAGGVAAVADRGDLIARPDPLADLNVPGVDVAVQRHRAVGVPELDPRAEARGGPASITTPSAAATIGVPIELARSMPPCSTPQR